jgi:polyhydroxyalkanoate synthesis regulator phasin
MAQWRTSHDEWFKTFVRRYPRAEVIGDILKSQNVKELPHNADAFFENRRFIAELKTLETSRLPKIQEIIDGLLERGEVAAFEGRKPVDQIIQHHPDRRRLNRQFLQEITKRLGRDFVDAHSQILETKDYFKAPSARGVFLVTNILLPELTPELVLHEISRLMMRGKKTGEYSYPEIELGIYIQTVSVIEVTENYAQMPVVIVTREEDEELSKFSTEFLKAFSAALGHDYLENDQADISAVMKRAVLNRRFRS